MSVVSTRDRVPQITAGGPMGRPGFMAPSGGAGLTPADIMKIVRKRKWLITLSVLIAAAIAAVVTLVWSMFWPFYTAWALLNVEMPKTVALAVSQQLVPKDVMDREKMSHAKLVLTTPVLQEAIKSPSVRRTAWFAQQRDPLAKLTDDLKVAPVAESTFIRIALTGTDKNDLPEVVNAVAEAYVAYSAQNMETGNSQDATRLEDEKRRLETELSDTRTQSAIAKRDFPNLQSNYNVQDIKLQDLTRQLMNLELLQAQARADLAVIEAQEKAGTLGTTREVQRVLDMDTNVHQLEFNLSQLVTQKDRLAEKLGPQHRQVLDLEATIEITGKELESRRNELISTAVRGLKSGAQANLENITKQVMDVREKYNEALNTLRDLQANLSTVQALAAKEETLNENIKRIDGRLLDLNLLSKGGERTISIAARATIPKDMSFPQWQIMMPAGIILGLMIGLGLAFLLEMMDTSIKSPSDISRRVDLPMLGMVPHAEDLDDEIGDLRLAFRTHPASLFCEAFRHIHTCLLFSGPASQRRTVLIASATPLDGRTTVALNLATAAARTGRRVLVVDTNFRQPMISQLFAQPAQEGISSALVGRKSWRDLVVEVESNLFVLPAGTLPPNPAELLASDQMRTVIAEMSAEYDQILFDSAPCLVVTDAVGLSTMVDGVVLVVRAGANTHGIVLRARDMLLRVGAHILGVVLNCVIATPGGYLRKNYEAFYDYHEKTQQLPAPAASATTK
ncbi:MAG: polysaccharide biosynthesis tyrosine autokinase [Phycisphaerae bacterium]